MAGYLADAFDNRLGIRAVTPMTPVRITRLGDKAPVMGWLVSLLASTEMMDRGKNSSMLRIRILLPDGKRVDCYVAPDELPEVEVTTLQFIVTSRAGFDDVIGVMTPNDYFVEFPSVRLWETIE